MNTSHRIAALRRHMDEHGITLCVITSPDDQHYLSGFKAVIYSRPIHLLVGMERTAFIVPGLEEMHAQAEAAVDDVYVYYEHPERAHVGTMHVHHLETMVRRLPRGARIGVQADHMPLALARHLEQLGMEIVDVGGVISRMRFIKDDAELALMMEAGRLAALGVRATLDAVAAGITELELDDAGNSAILHEVAARHAGAMVDLFSMSPSGAEKTVMPHVFSTARRLEPGDVIIHSRQVALNGYRGESERTCFVGRPTPAQQHAFEVMLEAQLAGIAALRPGVPMRSVDEASRRVIQQAGFGDNFIHRTGHGLGLSAHEPPFLRFDEDMLVEERMVFTIEPAFFIPGVGGFRHSDTAIVTADGCTITTELPYDLESMTR